ncbi:MAG: peptidoglycan-binding protein, partial [Mesorhizobium sp.]
MNSKRSYLDTLNAGRQRRPHTTLEQLNRSLETLEQRLERTREDTAERLDPRRQPEPRYASAQPYSQPLARDIDRVRGQEDSVAVVGKIAGELRGLREELRHQMTAGLKREFDALRNDIERAFQANGQADKGSAELGLEFERLSGA